jgi:hypothetical protein
MTDYEMIQNLLSAYCFKTDRGTAEEIGELFWADGRTVFDGNVHQGIETIVTGLQKWIDKRRAPLVGLRHMVHAPHIEIDGDTATSEVYYDADAHSKNRGKLIQLRGIYIDKLEKRNGEWRFIERETQIWRSALDHADAPTKAAQK